MAAGSRREEAVRGEVAGVVGGARLDRRRAPVAALAVVDSASFADQIGFCFLSVLPARMSVTRKAACGEIAAVPARVRAPSRRPSPSGPRISRIIRGGTRTPPLAIVAVGRGQVDRLDLDRAERAGQPGLQERLAAAGEPQPERLGGLVDLVVADPLERADGRDVERVLERLADEDRTALELVGVARRPVSRAIELGRHVEQQAARA